MRDVFKDAQRMERSEVEVEDIMIRFDLVDLGEFQVGEVARLLEDRRWCVTVSLRYIAYQHHMNGLQNVE
jgi:hypothetical protein